MSLVKVVHLAEKIKDFLKLIKMNFDIKKLTMKLNFLELQVLGTNEVCILGHIL